MIARQCGDDIRGVGHWHVRVPVASDAELDRLNIEHGERAPWMPDQDEMRPDERGAVVAFLRGLIHVGPRKREVLFARLQGLTWAEIGDSLLAGASPQAAEAAYSEAVREFPALKAIWKQKETK